MAEQMAWLEGQQIHVSGRIAQEVFPKVNPQIFADVLRERIDLSTYGEGIDKFYLTFIVMGDTVLKFEGEHYNCNSRKAEIAVSIPLEQVLDASQEQTIALMQQAYLEGIEQIAQLKLAAPFDFLALRSDVASVFAEPEWYIETLANYQ